MKVNKAAGLDKIPARLLKDAEVELAPSITYLVKNQLTMVLSLICGKLHVLLLYTSLSAYLCVASIE